MSPAGTSTEKSMSRPKFQWDLRTAPWTDGRGPQDEYADAVVGWCDMHGLLDEKNPNKLSPELRGTVLWSQLVARAKDVARKIPKEILMSKSGAKAVVAAVQRRDPLSVVSTVYSDFAALVSARRDRNESYKSFENRFKAHGDDITIPEPLLALMLLNGARVSDDQRVSILAASVTSMPAELKSLFTTTSTSSYASETKSDSNKTQEGSPSSPEGKTPSTIIWKPPSTSDYLSFFKKIKGR